MSNPNLDIGTGGGRTRPIVTIDPGHGPGSVNRGPTGYREHQGMWTLSGFLREALERSGISVRLTRTEDEDPSLAQRGIRSRGSTVFISQHSNAFNGQVRGCECFHSVRRPGDRVWAGRLSAAVSAVMSNNDRGAKTRAGTGGDFFGVIRSAASVGVPHIFLMENGFHDTVQDEAFLKVDANLRRIAEAQARVLCELLGVAYIS